MTKVHGKRYAYKFDFQGLMMACQAQAQAAAGSGSMAGTGVSVGGLNAIAANYAHHAAAAADLQQALYPAHTKVPPAR